MKSVNIIAMAGTGKRFKEKKFIKPKPLIEIKKKPMFYLATKSLPKSNQNIFISNIKLKEHSSFRLSIKKYFKNSRVIYVNRKTGGQASTCNLANTYFKDNVNVIYSSCDCEYRIKKKNYLELIKKNDVIIFVHKPTKNNILNYKEYGWVKKGKKNSVLNIECKKKASDQLKKDLVIVGTFAFKNKEIFMNSYKEMVKKKHKVNKEYYMDILVKYSKKLNYNVKYQLVKNFKSYGTPEELKNWKKNC